MVSDAELPDFDNLPSVQIMEFEGCAWGVFDKDGQKDQLGTLNLLTPSRVLAAAKEQIQCGERVSLNWGLDNIRFPSFGRKSFEHEVIDLASIGFAGYDEEISFNPQTSSHWNSVLHFAHQPSSFYYNGLKHCDFSRRSDLRNGIDNASRKGISGRGVLLDWYSWAVGKGRVFSSDARVEILISELDQVATEQGIHWEIGDILLVRTGFVKWHNTATKEAQKAGTVDAVNFLGLEANRNSFKWHWDHHFAAVAADNMTYEAWPPSSPGLHEYLLAMSGTIIGKLWDLEELSRVCREMKRWSFFLTSAPLNTMHGIGSPANALAFF